MRIKIYLVILISLISIRQGLCQKSIKATRTEVAPVVDGLVNDECWKTAAMVNEFYQREPHEGEPVTEKTEVYICYNPSTLYFGVKCYQDPKTISAKEMLRDADTGSDDRVHILLDTYLDHRNAFLFRITPLGAVMDASHSQNGTVYNNNWSSVWIGKAKITDEGWEAEFAIPFKSLSFDKNSTKWGLRLNRYISKNRELASWPSANVNATQFQISEAGILEGLEGITQGIGLDIAPYFVSGIDSRREENRDYKVNGGTDIYYQIMPSLKASLSINTDFAETEADARQINLTRFSLRLNEKRNFFLDGANYFSFGLEGQANEPPSGKISPFFSRTVGLNPDGSPIPVNYGAKINGQIKNWNLGLMHVSDDRDYGNSHFSVARVSYNIGKSSSVGMISTFGNSRESARNMLGGLDVKLATSSFMGDKNVSLMLFGLKSSTEGAGGKDISWGGTFSYPNDLINFRIGYLQIGENFNAGMGYVPRKNIRESFASLTIGPRLNRWGIRQITFGGNFDYVINFANQLQSKDLAINPLGIRFESGERFNYSLVRKYDYVDNDFNIYGDYIIPIAEYQWWENRFSFNTEAGRKLLGRVSYSYGDFYTGSKKSLELSSSWKIAIPVFLGGSLSKDIIRLPEGEFTADIYEINLNFLFSPDITLYNYVQYDSQSDVIGWQSRFQWILKPGNEILLVWNSGYSKPYERYSMDESALRFKIKYNIRF